MPITRDMVFPSKYLKADDIPSTGVDTTIEECIFGEVDYGDGPKMSLHLRLSGFDKTLGLNGTNWDSIAEMHGQDAEQWPGKSIRLYRTKTRNPQGATVPCIRVQPSLSGNGTTQPAQPQAPAQPTNGQMLTDLKKLMDDWKPSAEKVHASLGHATVSEYLKAGGTVGAALEKLTAARDAEALDDIPF